MAEVTGELQPVEFSDLVDWGRDHHGAALLAFHRSCREILGSGTGLSRPVRFGGSRPAWESVCREALETDAAAAQAFFERHFRPFRVRDNERPAGLFTGYFEPEVEGSRNPDAEHRVPLYRRPPDLVSFPSPERDGSGLAFGRYVGGKPRPYFTRREIEEGALQAQGLELVWLRDWADAFFIHVQGSGRVRLRDGNLLRLSYDGKTGLPYTSIGGLLAERGILSPESLSMQSIRAWMAGEPEAARRLMWENQSFIFFREARLEEPDLGALGAQHVQLTPRRSIAIDRTIWMFGTPVWLDTEVPTGDEGTMAPFHQLLIAQDTGSAIRGSARGDVYWGFGEEAARIAGPMKSPGAMTVLLPIAVAQELGLTP